jgi:Na+-transporting NADH:ubiquinone oxidoreductase subunit NqrF
VAEKDLLAARGLPKGVRLSCQILMEQDMEVKLISRLAGSGRVDTGKPTAEGIEPPAVWTTL